MSERTIFLKALEFKAPEVRAAFLDEQCAQNAVLRQRVEALLKAHEQQGGVVDVLLGSDEPTSSMHSLKEDAPPARAVDLEDLSFLGPSSTPGSLGSIGPYEVLEIIGRGGMGVVLKARDTKLQRIVAIKVLAPEIASNKAAKKRFEREAQAAAAVSHDHIVTIHAVDEFNSLPYLVMECIVGRSLQQKIEETGPLELKEILRIGMQAALGLAAAHKQGLVHRDIKPANILLQNGIQRVKITDFGLARATDDVGMTHTGQIAGTPMYMSPEQAQGERVDHLSDLFSLGSVLYTMCTGRPAFRAPNTVAVLRRVVDDTPRPILEVNSELPEWLVAIVNKLLSKKKEDRYQTAAEVAELLSEHLSLLQEPRSRPTVTPPGNQSQNLAWTPRPSENQSETDGRGVHPTVSQQPALVSAAPVVRDTDHSQSPTPLSRTVPPHRNWLLVGAGAVALVILGVILITITNKDGTKTKIEVPGDSKIEITNSRSSPASPQSPPPNPSSWHGWPADAPKPAIAPFDAAQAKQHQEEWAAYLKVPVEYTNSIGMKFRLIPPGEFMMGSTAEEVKLAIGAIPKDHTSPQSLETQYRSEAPQHRVILTEPFYYGVTETTQSQFELVMGHNPSAFSATGKARDRVNGIDTKQFPVENLTYDMAVAFCDKLGALESGTQDHRNSTISDNTPFYRLPTEAQFEFSCRAGTESLYWCGNTVDELGQSDWISFNSHFRMHAVGEKQANPFGLFDVHGNAWEWCHGKWSDSDYSHYTDSPAINPSGIASLQSVPVMRGGGATFEPVSCRAAHRRPTVTTSGGDSFRATLSVGGVRQSLASRTSQKDVASSWHGWPADAPKPAIAPFDAAQAKQHQEEWAAYLKVPVEYTNFLDMKFRLIPPGEFTMGSTAEESAAALKEVSPDDKHRQECIKSEAPLHKVILTQPIYLGVNEVTQAEYEKIMGVNPSHFAPMGAGKEAVAGLETAEHPVEMVSWNDAAEFCAKLSKQEKLKPFYFRVGETITPLDGTGYRLPSEAEWEFACRAGTATKYWIGDKDEDLVRAGWFGGNSGGRTHAAGELKANPFGLSDIHGNVWEWVQDGWDATYYGQFPEKPAIDPSRPFLADSRRVVRGGVLGLTASHCRSSIRSAHHPAGRDVSIGFRVSLPIDAVRQTLKVMGAAMPKPVATTPSAPARWYETPQFKVWASDVALMPIVKQVEAVSQKLVELNPAFDGNVTPEYGNDEVTGLEFRTDHVTDISPVRALVDLRALRCPGAWRNTVFQDLSPLKGMALTELSIEGTRVSDLTPLKDMKLSLLRCGYTPISDLSPLKHMTLTTLNCWHTPVSDLSPLNPAKLTTLEFNGTAVPDLTALNGFKLKSLSFSATKISDLTPLREMQLESLDCGMTPVSDLSPLENMKLKYLSCGITPVSSLLPLKDSELTSLICADTQVSDLSPLAGKKLTSLYCGNTRVTDLTPLQGMPLHELHCQGASVTDYYPLKGSSLRQLSLDFKPDRDTELLRSIKSLQTVNGKPVTEFWKDVEK